MKQLFVIIVTYNGSEWIDRCLQSVFASSVKSTIVVVDNGSTDGTISIIQERYPSVKLLETGENLGFGKANNKGIIYAIDHGAEYVYLLNQDAWVDSDVFEVLIKQMELNPRYGILSPIQINARRNAVDSNFLHGSISEKRCPHLKSDLLMHEVKDVYETYFVMAAHWLVSVEAIKKVGMFSDAFSHYGEDLNLVQRMRFHEFKIGICPGVYAVHDREFRKESIAKQAYLYYIRCLTRFHDIDIDDRKVRVKIFFRSLVKIILHKGVSISCKLRYCIRIVLLCGTSSKYRRLYKGNNYYEVQRSGF
ncbi:MAG: glycosyltransferase family 2 protein [Prevotella sp.]|nr:glycosyltransferase family 2 protein [Prevotella sp.]